MADIRTDAGSAAGTARLMAAISALSRSSGWHGAAPSSPEADSQLGQLLIHYFAQNSHERDGLSEALRAALTSVDSSHPDDHRGSVFRYYLQGSHSSQTPAMIEPIVSAMATSHCDYGLLENHRSDVASLARFSQRVEHATWYLFTAVDGQAAPEHWRPTGASIRRSPKSWYGALARQCFSRWSSARKLLVVDWSIPDTVEPLYRTAFWSLCELTPADSQLKLLFERDRGRACRELVRHVDAYAGQLELATDLAEAISDDETAANRAEDEARRDAVQAALLERAGERLTLTEAAARLKITRQALHKKIKGDAALGLMIGETFVVPSAQFVSDASGLRVVAHLKEILSLFSRSGAGSWSALQYLIEPDPVLEGGIPLDLLKAGQVARVVTSARGFLGLDEG